MKLVKCDLCGTTNRIREHSVTELPLCGTCGARIGVEAETTQSELDEWFESWTEMSPDQQKKLYQECADNTELSNSQRLGCKAQVLWMNGDLDGALRNFDEAIRLAPDDSRELLNRANLHFERGDWDAAHRDYEQSLRGRPALPHRCYTNYQILKKMSAGTKARLAELKKRKKR